MCSSRKKNTRLIINHFNCTNKLIIRTYKFIELNIIAYGQPHNTSYSLNFIKQVRKFKIPWSDANPPLSTCLVDLPATALPSLKPRTDSA